MTHLALRVLNGCHLSLDGHRVEKLPSKAIALVCFVALSQRAVRREELLALLWDSASAEDHSANLRVTLSKLRKELPGVLMIDRHSIGLNVNADYEIDCQRFSFLIEEDDVASLEEALDLYQTEFLTGLSLPDAPVFEEWQQLRREKFRAEAMQTMQRLLSHYRDQGENAKALQCALRLVEFEPWHEATHRQLMELYALKGDLSNAMTQFERCKTMLAKELGLEPSRDTLLLKERIKKLRYRPKHNLPQQIGPFIGRKSEQEALISDLSTKKGRRLVTLFAPGGMGKTRLARELGYRLVDYYLEGIFWIPLEDTPDMATMLAQLCDLLGLDSRRDLETAVLSELRDMHCLLILDNCEHLVEELAEFVPSVLQNTSEVKLLVTSRERLNLPSEQSFYLGGLSFPQSYKEDARDFSGVALFISQAERLQVAIKDLETVVAIVSYVAGHPLAIELVASWTRVLSVQEIAEALQQSGALLAAQDRRPVKRHRSMNDVFEQSWRFLAAEERRSLEAIAVFPTGFSREAVEAVAQLSLTMLSRLVDKAMLVFNEGRYSQHPLLRQFTQKHYLRWPQKEKILLQQRYSRYYLSMLQPAEALRWQSKEIQRSYQATITRELSHIHQGFEWAMESQLELVKQTIRSLGSFHDVSGRTGVGQPLIQRLLANCEDERLAAQLMVQDARAYYIRGLSERAIVRAQEVLMRWQHDSSMAEELVAANNILGFSIQYKAGYESAKPYFEKALGMIDAASVDLQALVLGNLGNLEADYGNAEQGLGFLEQSYQLAKESGNLEQTIITLNNLSGPLLYLGQVDEAQRVLEEGLALAKDYHHLRTIPYFYNGLGDIALVQKNYKRAKDYYHEGLEAARYTHETGLEASLYAMKARACNLLGAFEEAQAFILQAFLLSREVNIQMLIPSMSIFVAENALLRQEYHEAAGILAAIEPHLKLLHNSERELFASLLQAVPEELKIASKEQTDLKTLEQEMINLLSTKYDQVDK